MPSINLTSDDVIAIKAIRAFCAAAERDAPGAEAAYQATLSAMRDALSEPARAAWNGWSSSRITAEIERWRPAYQLKRTHYGITVYRWLKGQDRYAKRAAKNALTEREAEAYRDLVRC